jgi:RNA polymerase sigma-70 factor, ECF subfamily
VVSAEIFADALQTIEGIEGVYDDCKGIAYGLAFQILREQTAAEDVVQEAFLSAWRSRRRYDPSKGTVKTWLLTIVRNRAIDRLRQDRSRGRMLELDVAEMAVDGSDDPATVEPERLWIREAVQALPAAQREAILLSYFGGYTHIQIATRKNLPLGTVKAQLRLGIKKLSVAMAPVSSGNMIE